MYCKQCGNEIGAGQKFCPKCGRQLAAGTVPLSSSGSSFAAADLASSSGFQPFSSAAPSVAASGSRTENWRKWLPWGLVAALAVVLILFWVGKGLSQSTGMVSFSPVGSWQIDGDWWDVMEFRFTGDGKLRIGVAGVWKDGLYWEKGNGDEIYVSGELPQVLGISFGSIGMVMNYDQVNKQLIWEIGGQKVYLKRK